MTLSDSLHGGFWAPVGDLKSINAAVAIDFDFSSLSTSCVSGVLSGADAILSFSYVGCHNLHTCSVFVIGNFKLAA